MRYSRSYSSIEHRSLRYVKPYGVWNFLWDLFMIFITGGLWLIWIFCREMRRR